MYFEKSADLFLESHWSLVQTPSDRIRKIDFTQSECFTSPSLIRVNICMFKRSCDRRKGKLWITPVTPVWITPQVNRRYHHHRLMKAASSKVSVFSETRLEQGSLLFETGLCEDYITTWACELFEKLLYMIILSANDCILYTFWFYTAPHFSESGFWDLHHWGLRALTLQSPALHISSYFFLQTPGGFPYLLHVSG